MTLSANQLKKDWDAAQYKWNTEEDEEKHGWVEWFEEGVKGLK